MVRWRLCTDSSYFQNKHNETFSNTMMQNKKVFHTMQMILVCTSCIGQQIDYIPLRHYQYVTNVSDTLYSYPYILLHTVQKKRSPFWFCPFLLFRGGNAADLGPDLEVHRYDVLRCIAYLQFQIQTLHRSCKVVGIFSGIAEA